MVVFVTVATVLLLVFEQPLLDATAEDDDAPPITTAYWMYEVSAVLTFPGLLFDFY